MATHDYVIANQSGAAFRTDLNNALAAIVSNNSNSSEPATKYAYQWWADTSAAVMKLRNSANDGWIELFQLDGTLTLEDGSVSAPGLAFRDDLNTGIFSSAADTFNVATGGVERMELGATTIFNEDGADVDFRIESDSNANMFFLDAGNNRLTIGANSGSGTFNVTGTAGGNSVELTDGTNSTLRIAHYSSAIARIAAGSSQNLALGTGFAEKMRIDTSGNVLIGTTDSSAGSKLIVDTDIAIVRSSSDPTLNFILGSASSPTKLYRFLIDDDNADAFQLRELNTVRISLDTSGRVHINTTTNRLGEALHVLGQGIVTSSAESTNMMLFGTFGGSDALIGAFNDIDVVFRQNNTEQMRIDTDGRLLVGQTTRSSTEAASKLCVSVAISGGGQGVITATDTSSNDFGCGLVVNKASSTTTSSARFIQFYANNFGQPMGGIVGNGTENAQLVTLSDERYKKNIKPLSGILEKINKLKTISFDWKHKNESVKAGFIAQNVQEIFPEYVVDNIGNDKSNKKMGTTGGMSAGYIAILTAAIQELSAKVAALEAA